MPLSSSLLIRAAIADISRAIQSYVESNGFSVVREFVGHGVGRSVHEDPQVPKAGHNINFGWLVLRRAGVELGGVTYDSMLASFVLDPGRRSHALDRSGEREPQRDRPELGCARAAPGPGLPTRPGIAP